MDESYLAVDEKTGMCDWASPAAVMLSFITMHLESDLHRWLAPALQDTPAEVDHSDDRFAAIVGTDVEGYSYEFFQINRGSDATAGFPPELRAAKL